jgi:hypothetical protein
MKLYRKNFINTNLKESMSDIFGELRGTAKVKTYPTTV